MGLSLKSIGKMVSLANTIGTGINAAKMIGGLNLSSINPDNISGVKDTIMSNLNGQSNNLVSQISSVIDVSEIEGMVGGLNIENQVNQMMGDIQDQAMSGNFDPNSMDIEGQVNQMMNQMGLENIKFM